MQKMDHSGCLLCSPGAEKLAFSDDGGFAIWDLITETSGHLLIVPQRHATEWDGLSAGEKIWLWSAVHRAVDVVRSRFRVLGFNVSFATPSQGAEHFHLRVIPAQEVARDERGIEPRTLSSPDGPSKQRLIKGDSDPFLPHLVQQMDQATVCNIAVAFLLPSGANLVVEHLKDFLNRGGVARILVSDYLDVTDPDALRRIADLKGDLTFKIYETRTKAFHLKSYLFLSDRGGVAFVGSSNLSQAALTTSIEWNYKIVSSYDVAGFRQIREGFEDLFHRAESVSVTEPWIARYEERRSQTTLGEIGVGAEPVQLAPQPHPIQESALAALEHTRELGFTAGLVVLATGLGKTWLAAFDSDRADYRKILFVAHREEILDQAVSVFRQVHPGAHIGRLSGEHRDVGADILFASIQTLGRLSHLSTFQAGHFDYIVVDEFHHAAANTYRRVIEHFVPKFLLGLTATPDRTDGANLLSLCQENLVFEADIRAGIEGGRLCPFQYLGVADDVDYTNIPWRSSQFDLTELTAAVATEARAENALGHFQKYGGRRAIGFCCSQRHADFMAEFFSRHGVRSTAVHAGASSAPRATSLEMLRDGELDIIFAVDMFNEGVDVPAIDTVLMLRPTESTVIWMQQIGRGLRVSAFKSRLVVIDYIGNHRAFLTKLQGMATVLDRPAESHGRQRELLQAIRDERISLPVGCEVTYDLTVIDIYERLLRPSRVEDAMEDFYRDFEQRNGVRPTATETFHAGLNPRSNSERSWLGFVERMGGLNVDEVSTWSALRQFFSNLEKTELSRSYKIVLLLAFFEEGTLRSRLTIDDAAKRALSIVRRVHLLAEDFSAEVLYVERMKQLLISNPIEAFVGARAMGGVPYFTFDGSTFGFAFEIQDVSSFSLLLREILDWRLAQYLSRGKQTADFVGRVSRNAADEPILLLPSGRSGSSLQDGSLTIEVNGRTMEAIVARNVLGVLRDLTSAENVLPNLLRIWFGERAGQIGRSDRVQFRFDSGDCAMEPLVSSQSAGPKLWNRMLREEIPRAFEQQFNPAIWNAGLVVSEPHIFLLVTLTKDDMNPEHQYADHFISENEFSWQSQNQNTRESKRGQLLRNHRSAGSHVHLFVRPSKKTGNRPTPFIYCGEVDFIDWEGDRPITIRWRLREAVPPSMRGSLKVPASDGR